LVPFPPPPPSSDGSIPGKLFGVNPFFIKGGLIGLHPLSACLPKLYPFTAKENYLSNTPLLFFPPPFPPLAVPNQLVTSPHLDPTLALNPRPPLVFSQGCGQGPFSAPPVSFTLLFPQARTCFPGSVFFFFFFPPRFPNPLFFFLLTPLTISP